MSFIRDIGQSLGNSVMENVGRAMGRAQEQTPLPVDLLESDDEYLAVFDAPGATSTDVQVQFHEGRIEVRIDRFRGFYDEFEMRYPGRGLALDGSVELPEHATIDPDQAKATLRDDGTLEVRVPKIEVAAEAEEWERKTDTEAVDDETTATGGETSGTDAPTDEA